ncbi:MAG: glycosyltransferase family 4 protein [Saprospiraceae bacterium]|nr:glycosyltransferase family 4 protein [Saprospiraceae bacterium]
MVLSSVSYKPCWQVDGTWYSSGGFPLQMNGVAQPFKKMYLHVPVVAARPGGIAISDKVEVIPIPSPRGKGILRKLFVFLTALNYYRLFYPHFKKSEAVMVPLPGDLPLIALFFALILGKRTMARYGSSWSKTNETSFMHSFTKFLMRRLGKGKKHVMLVTGNGEDSPSEGLYWLFSTALSKKIVETTIPNRSSELQNPVKLVYIGRLSPEKGVLFFPEILNELSNRLNDSNGKKAELHLIGDGPLRDELENEFAKRGMSEEVVFHGLLNQGDLFGTINQMDICIQPSKTEGFSKAWLDAMVCGIPVISSRVGAAEYVIGTSENHRGWLVEPGNPGAIVNLLDVLLTKDQNWVDLRSRCRDFASKKTLELWSARIKAICEERWQTELS